MTLRSLKCWAGPHPGVVLSQQAGQTGEENPAVHLALLLPQQEAGAGAEGHPGQVLQDQEGELLASRPHFDLTELDYAPAQFD